MKIVIAAGGTAGHVVPALAVADALRAEGAHVVFVGGERAERMMVPAAGYELQPIAVEGMSRSNPLKAARALARWARRVCLAFPIPGRDGDRYLVTGRAVPPPATDRAAARARFGIGADETC